MVLGRRVHIPSPGYYRQEIIVLTTARAQITLPFLEVSEGHIDQRYGGVWSSLILYLLHLVNFKNISNLLSSDFPFPVHYVPYISAVLRRVSFTKLLDSQQCIIPLSIRIHQCTVQCLCIMNTNKGRIGKKLYVFSPSFLSLPHYLYETGSLAQVGFKLILNL